MGEQTDQPATAVTVEQTSKKLKLQSALSVVLLIIGAVWLWTAISADAESTTIPAWMTTIGMIWYITTRIRIWWHHK